MTFIPTKPVIMKNVLVVAISLWSAFFPLNAQQIKRNLVANSCFEEGFKHWRKTNSNLAQFCISNTEAISGSYSAEIEIMTKGNNSWDETLYYILPVERNASYRISFKVKSNQPSPLKLEFCPDHTDYTPFDLKAFPSGFVAEESNRLRGTIQVGTEATEYVFTTQPTNDVDWNTKLAFHFGQGSPGTIFWLDDVRISRSDEGDWNGNLLPAGDFETKTPITDTDFSLDIRDETPSYNIDTWEIDKNNPINGKQSLHIVKNSTATDRFWNFVFDFLYGINEEADVQISFKARSNKDGQIIIKTNSDPWDSSLPAGDALVLEPLITPSVQTYTLNRKTAIRGNKKNSGLYTNTYKGKERIFGSFTTPITPQGFEMWIDDIVVSEYNLELQDFEVLNIPKELKINDKIQLTIAEFVTPTHAPTSVIYKVVDGVGKATIDQDGNLLGLKMGDITVEVSNPSGTVTKSFVIEIVNEYSSIHEDENPSTSDNILLRPTIVNRGETISLSSIDIDVYQIWIYDSLGNLVSCISNNPRITTQNLSAGVYITKIELENRTSIKKFIVK